MKLFNDIWRTFAVLLICSVSYAQPRLEKLWTTDTLSQKGPESATYHSPSNTVFISSMRTGSVVQMDITGKVIKQDWVTGLTSNKGFGFYNNFLYNAETNTVAVIDMNKAAIVKRISVEGSVMLNDVDVDANGIIYVTDTRAGKVYRIEGDTPSLFLENIPGANGLLCVGTDVYVAGATVFLKVNAKKEITPIGEGYEAGLDGIVLIAPDQFILSNYRGMIYYVQANGTKYVLMDSREAKIQANDISYDPHTKTLFVPSFGSNWITAYRVHHK